VPAQRPAPAEAPAPVDAPAPAPAEAPAPLPVDAPTAFTQPAGVYAQPGTPYAAPGYPISAPPYGAPGYPPPFPPPFLPAQQPPAQKRRGLVIGLVVAALVVLAGGGTAAFLLTRDTTKGQSSPSAAIDGFLTAVYTDNNVAKASTYVCSDARDRAKLTTKINEIKRQDTGYEGARYTWSTPKTEQTRKDETILTATVTLRTTEEQKATQNLRFVTTRSNGWFVCEIQQTG
jgi:hypothetical protein